MLRSTFLLFLFLLVSACASFDKTNIQPGQRVPGLGFSFIAPTQKTWFTVEYGTSHRIKLSQLNDQDSYSILVSLNRGPRRGMYQSAEAHLKALRRNRRGNSKSAGFLQHQHKEMIDTRYGDLCVRYTSSGEDWRGRNNEGPAIIDSIGLSCAHPETANILISIEITRRSETDAATIDLATYADELFSSVEYQDID